MAFTNVLPGSGLYPDLRLQWAPTTQPTDTTQVWEDITDLMRGWSWGYGRNDELATFEAGTGSVLLDNRDRLFDPSYTDGDSTNLVTNGGFETNTTGWSSDGTATLARNTDPTFVRYSDGSMSVVLTGANGYAYSNPGGVISGASGGRSFTASMWVYAGGAAAGSTLRHYIRFTGGATATQQATSDTVLVAGWQRLTILGTSAQNDRTHVDTIAQLLGIAGQFFFIDGVQIEEALTANRYIETNGSASSRLAANIKPRRMFELVAEWDGTEYPVFVAYARGFPQSYPAAGFDSVVQVDLIGAEAILQGTDLVVGFTRSAELSSARIEAVLDAVNIPAASRDLDTGTVTTAAIDVTDEGVSGLRHAKDVSEQSEFGQLFAAKDGRLTFHNRHRRINGSSSHTFGDGGGSELPYGLDTEPDYDETYLWNYVRVTGPTGDPATADDTASTDDYFTLVRNVSSQLDTFPDRDALAEYMVDRYKQPEKRLASLPLNGAMEPDDLWPVILALEVSDRITVLQRPMGGAVVTLVQNVEGIRHSCQPGGPWLTSVAMSPADTNEYWVLQDAALGLLEDTTVLAP